MGIVLKLNATHNPQHMFTPRDFCRQLHEIMGFPGGSNREESACSEEMQVRSLGWEESLAKGMATHSSILA